MYQSTSKHKSSLHTTGEHTWLFVSLLHESKCRKEFIHSSSGLWSSYTMISCIIEKNIVGLVKSCKIHLLWHKANEWSYLLRMLIEINTEHLYTSGSLIDESTNYTKSCTLSSSIRSKKSRKTPFFNTIVEILNYRSSSFVFFHKIRYFESKGHRGFVIRIIIFNNAEWQYLKLNSVWK